MVSVNKAVVEWNEYQEAQEKELELEDQKQEAKRDDQSWKQPQED